MEAAVTEGEVRASVALELVEAVAAGIVWIGFMPPGLPP